MRSAIVASSNHREEQPAGCKMEEEVADAKAAIGIRDSDMDPLRSDRCQQVCVGRSGRRRKNNQASVGRRTQKRGAGPQTGCKATWNEKGVNRYAQRFPATLFQGRSKSEGTNEHNLNFLIFENFL